MVHANHGRKLISEKLYVRDYPIFEPHVFFYPCFKAFIKLEICLMISFMEGIQGNEMENHLK